LDQNLRLAQLLGDRGLIDPAVLAAAWRRLEVEPHAGRRNDVQVQLSDVETSVSTQPLDAASDLIEGVLRQVDERRALARHLEAAEACSARGDRDSEVEPKPRFAGLRSAANEADRLLAP